jgi:hypothetical protein
MNFWLIIHPLFEDVSENFSVKMEFGQTGTWPMGKPFDSPSGDRTILT